MTTDDDDAGGYGRPPKRTRFRKGQSGNPRGRPRGTKNLKTDLQEELLEKIQVRDSKGIQRITKQKALVKSMIAKAIKGDPRSASIMMELALRLLTGNEADHDDSPLSGDEEAILNNLKRRTLDGRRDKTNDGDLE